MKRVVYKILKDYNLVLEHYSGDIGIEDIKQLKVKLSEDSNFNKKYDILMDFRGTELNISEKDITEFIPFVINIPNYLYKRRSSLLTSYPEHVVVMTIYNSQKVGIPMDTEIFTTPVSALHWTNQYDDMRYLLDTIEGMKKD